MCVCTGSALTCVAAAAVCTALVMTLSVVLVTSLICTRRRRQRRHGNHVMLHATTPATGQSHRQTDRHIDTYSYVLGGLKAEAKSHGGVVFSWRQCVEFSAVTSLTQLKLGLPSIRLKTELFTASYDTRHFSAITSRRS